MLKCLNFAAVNFLLWVYHFPISLFWPNVLLGLEILKQNYCTKLGKTHSTVPIYVALWNFYFLLNCTTLGRFIELCPPVKGHLNVALLYITWSHKVRRVRKESSLRIWRGHIWISTFVVGSLTWKVSVAPSVWLKPWWHQLIRCDFSGNSRALCRLLVFKVCHHEAVWKAGTPIALLLVSGCKNGIKPEEKGGCTCIFPPSKNNNNGAMGRAATGDGCCNVESR